MKCIRRLYTIKILLFCTDLLGKSRLIVSFSGPRAAQPAVSVQLFEALNGINHRPEILQRCIELDMMRRPYYQPAAWDDIHFVDGHPGKFVCLARRKGSDWFVAGINADEPRDLTVPLDFLKPGSYPVKLYRDSTGGREITVEELTVKTTKGLRIAMQTNGGFAVRFSK